MNTFHWSWRLLEEAKKQENKSVRCTERDDYGRSSILVLVSGSIRDWCANM